VFIGSGSLFSFHNKRHPKEMGGIEIKAFLTHLAVWKNVAASTQNQALNSLVFLYRQLVRLELEDFGQFERAKRPTGIPVVLTQEETGDFWRP
jgi:hypothetical protein